MTMYGDYNGSESYAREDNDNVFHYVNINNYG